MTETAIQTAIRLEAARIGWKLWRNNVGACQDARGRWIRYGLANDSKALNQVLKSGDLIGWRPITVGGLTLAQFVSIECKSENGPIHTAQQAWADMITQQGGHALIARGPDDIL